MKLINKYKIINNIRKIISLQKALFLINKNEIYQLKLYNLSMIKIPIVVQWIKIITFDQNFKLIIILTSDNKINILHRPLFLLFQYISYSRKVIFMGFITKYQTLIVITKISVDIWKKTKKKSLFLKKKFLKDNSRLKNFYLGNNSLFLFLHYGNFLKILKIDSNFQQYIDLRKIGIEHFLNVHLYETITFYKKGLNKDRTYNTLIISQDGKIIKFGLKNIKVKNKAMIKGNKITKYKWTIVKKLSSLNKTKISDSNCDTRGNLIVLLINNSYFNIYSLTCLKFLRKMSFINYYYDKCLVTGKYLILANRKHNELVMIDYKKEKIINILLTSKVPVKKCLFTYDSKFIILCLDNSILKLGKVCNFTKTLEIHNIYLLLNNIVAFNGSYRIMGCGDDNKIFIYSLIELKFKKLIKLDCNSKILSIQIDKKDKNFYATNSNFEIFIGSVKNLNIYKVVYYNTLFITDLLINSIERKIIVSSMDKTIKVIEYEKNTNNVVVFYHEYPVIFSKTSTFFRNYLLSFTTHRLMYLWSEKNFCLVKIFNLDSMILDSQMKSSKLSTRDLFQIQFTSCEILQDVFFISCNLPLLISFKIMKFNKQLIQSKESFFFNEAFQKTNATKKICSIKNNYKTIQSSFGRYILIYEKRYLFVFKNIHITKPMIKSMDKVPTKSHTLEENLLLSKNTSNKSLFFDENINTLFLDMNEDAFKNIFLNIRFLNVYQKNVLFEMISKNIFKLIQTKNIFNIFLGFILNDSFIRLVPSFWMSIFKLIKDYLDTMILIVDKLLLY
ncbi:hypothetical protein BNATCHR282 (nucleomorph) [Bigelowiella natans]|uniref:Uncharacterized protein n=1 Tax=Bigelowiella natans TaxID=227086 RepID=Q3LWC0_BIGNA|nr:hypothetical protein BNATCHR282 [Bigelowiella natans]ABA27246.1 hypothetical protein [Bigelowiella natans]